MRTDDLELDLIGSVLDAVAARLGHEPSWPCAEFVRQFFHWVPAQDLRERELDVLAGTVLGEWELSARRQPGEAKVRVFNPEAWRSPYTVVEIVCDDMPFLVDSVTMELSRRGHAIELLIHPVMRMVRSPDGILSDVVAPEAGDVASLAESIIHVELARQRDPARLEDLREGIGRVLGDVRAAVEDWHPMRERTAALAAELAEQPPPCETHLLAECREFLAWLADGHFTFLGYREYELGDDVLIAVPGTGLGILRDEGPGGTKSLSERAIAEAHRANPLVLSKANTRSTVHRPAYLDYIGVKRFDANGAVLGERRFLGLYTSSAYHAPPTEVPLLRDKVQRIMQAAAFPADSHDAKGLIDILESLPRDLLIQIATDDLFEMAMGVLGLGERQRVRLFVSRDRLDRFVAATLCMPRERFTTENGRRASTILAEAFGGDHVDWRLQLSQSVVVRVDYTVHCGGGIREANVAEVEARIAQATRNWGDDLRAALVQRHGEERGAALDDIYADAFPRSYRALVEAATAVDDIARIERLRSGGRALLAVHRRPGDPERMVRAKLFSASPVTLSEVVPTFEHMGARVVDERPYEIRPAGGVPVWVYDVGLSCDPADLDRAGEEFAATFLGVWTGRYEDDRLNGLVMRVGLSGRQITVLRAILRYLRQAVIPFSDAYMISTLLENPAIAAQLVALFEARFDPDARDDPADPRAARVEQIRTEIVEAIDSVASLDADRILSSVLAAIEAMLRTNHWRHVEEGSHPDYLSFKLDPTKLDMLPLPRPRFEIFVYSARVEGIHLRGGRVARGGLRWSDRREDFRTEVLGLMKAQMVKNALIVPVGSKGGFVVKRPPPRTGSGAERDAYLQEGIDCYRTFLHGLLDLTDNYVEDRVVPPERVVRYDGDDPYLVVAADKGTARFSDIANSVSEKYGFWLGDAFASGGSHGYDHKAMGITARGTWESVKRHFRELGLDVAVEPFSVVGVGDMAGDVFGNGMLRSRQIRLVAAFNHAHIFLDPDPDPALGYAERRRLFDLPRSAWSDYSPEAISEGGGVYPRTAKSIEITPQVRAALGIEAVRMSPNELVSAILRAPVDLLYNGGIGTYVKASGESHAEVGDRSNDAVRVDGTQLRCRVVAEGGNLGLTQRGRIEYALRGGPEGAGGRINTDAIDNAAGVNCSDHEVNIKILLGDLIADGKLSEDQRDTVLESMTDAVAEEVLYGSYTQTQSLSLALRQSVAMRDVHARLLRWLESNAALNREIEVLPTEKTLAQRRAERRGLVSPELAVVMAYVKIALYEELLESDLPDDPYLLGDLERYFPAPLGTGSASADRAPAGTVGAERYTTEIRQHRLRRELVATIVAGQLVDRGGTTFAFRLGEEMGVTAPQLARAFAVAREVFEMRDFWDAIEDLDNRIEAGTQMSMLLEGRRLVERASRWLCRARARTEIDVTQTAHHFEAGVRELYAAIPEVLTTADRAVYDARLDELSEAGVPSELARRVASMPALLSVFDIVEDAAVCGTDQETAMCVYFGIGERLSLDWLRDRVLELPRADRWQALARSALRDDLYELHRMLTREIIQGADGRDGVAAIEVWLERNAESVARARGVLADVRASEIYDTTTLPVVVRELKNLASEAAPLS
ncbi:MAG TPA: NAD-glutamate dehydrogenase [Solirubrobacteraceae bacterium]|nr:NAD-glutamate dehydrogenase [Solirubrobacteraceae bacterium]